MLWMAVTADEYELPLCVTDTAAELAAKYNNDQKQCDEFYMRRENRQIPWL